MECSNYTERDCYEKIELALSIVTSNFQIFIADRTFANASYYNVTYVVRTATNNTDAVDALIKLSLESDEDFNYIGSTNDYLNGNLEVDLHRVIAKIQVKKV